MTPAAVARLIDHTLLRPDATREDIQALCREALELGFAAVCVNPAWVSSAAAILAGSRVAVCSVVAFPLGSAATEVKAFEARTAIGEGAREIDMVINVGWLKGGDRDGVRRDIDAVMSVCRAGGALSKVIIETALLTDEEKATACTLARDAGADFVKTSTGFGPGGATVHDVVLMRGVVGPKMGIKAAGGIRDLVTVVRLVEAGATRIGTSAGVKIITEATTAEAAECTEK